MNTEKVLFALLRSAVCGERLNDEVKSACTPELLAGVYALAVRQDIAHLIGYALQKLALPESALLEKLKEATLQAVYRQVQLEYEYGNICSALEQEKIPFVPLKGTVLRAYYPEPWMRTSCDTDILVKEEDLTRAIGILEKKLGYTSGGKSDHDVSLHSLGGIHLELHYDTIQERYEVNGCRDVLGQIWEAAAPKETGSCHLWLTDEMFYFYHIAHMTKHFQNGGCGIRPFLDIWIMNHKMPYDRGKREALLREGGLYQFAQAAQKVSEVWFSGAQPDAMDTAVMEYILGAGIYGSNANRAAIGQAKNGGRFKYLLTRRVFMPYDYLKAEYPILKKHKWLFPVYQVVRWGRMLRSGRLGATWGELKANLSSGDSQRYSAEDILKHLGL